MGQIKRPGMMTAWALLLLATVVSSVLLMRKSRAEDSALALAHQAMEERDRARKAEAEAKRQYEEALEAAQKAEKERAEARTEVAEARHSEEDLRAVLAFLQNNVFSPGRPRVWTSAGPKKDVTLRQVVDAAEPIVAEMFAHRPLVEASIREILGTAYLSLGATARAVKEYERALALRQAVLGPDHPDTIDCRNKLAVAYRLDGHPDKASRLYDRAPDSPSFIAALAVQGAILLAENKPVEAELKLRECLTICQQIQPDDWTTFLVKSMLGEALLEQQKYAEAERLLQTGYEGMKQRAPQDKVPLTKALDRLVRLYEAWGKKDEAMRWRKELEKVEDTKKR